MEEIIGEIQDEHDTEEPLLVEESKGTYLVDGKMNIDDLSDRLGIGLVGEGYETLGGFILTMFDRLPHAGEYVDFEDLRFLIVKLSKRRITKVRISRLPETQDKSVRQPDPESI
jgi:CBS domain containing-hemolysin-like protein